MERNNHNWKLVKLGEACTIVMGQSPPSTSYNTDEVGLPFFQGKAEFTELHPVAEKWCNAPNKIALPNDILLSVRAPVGTTNIADQKCCIGRGLAAIRFENYKYAFYFLRSIQQELDSKGTGTTFRAISGETIRETLFPLPPKEVQKQIVSKIEELFSELDKGIEELKTAQQQLKVYRQAVLKWAFEGKLTNEDVKDGELPEGWTLQNIGSIAKLINGDRGKNYPNRSEYVDKGIAFINTGHIEPNGKLSLKTMHYLTREKFNSLNSGKIQKGDLLYCLRGATLGKTAIVDQFEEGAIASSLVIIRLNKEISNRFVYYFLTGPLGRDCIFQFDNGSAQPNLSAKSVTLYKIPLASFEEQLQVVQEIESRFSVCDKIEESITASLKQAEALRQSILKKAFEGTLSKNYN